MPAILFHFAGPNAGTIELQNVDLGLYFPQLPLDEDGHRLWPDHFCGLRARHVFEFFWQNIDQERIDFPNEGELLAMDDGENFFFNGLDVVGPIETCRDPDTQWQWRFPLTADGVAPFEGTTLILDMDPPNAGLGPPTIEFIDSEGRRIPMRELYSDSAWEAIADREDWLDDICARFDYCTGEDEEDEPVTNPPVVEEGLITIALGVSIFDQHFQEWFNSIGANPSFELTPPDTPPDQEVTATIEGLNFQYAAQHQSTVLNLVGTFEQSGNNQAFSVLIDLPPQLVSQNCPEESNTIVAALGFAFRGILEVQIPHDFQSFSDLLEEQINTLFQATTPGSLGGFLQSIRIPVACQAISSLEKIVYPDSGTRPQRSTWRVELDVVPAASSGFMDAVVVNIGQPILTNGIPQLTPIVRFIPSAGELLPANTGLSTAINRNFVQSIIDVELESIVGEPPAIWNQDDPKVLQKLQDRSEIESLEISIEEDNLAINGSILLPANLARIEFSGPAFPFLYRGLAATSADMSSLEVHFSFTPGSRLSIAIMQLGITSMVRNMFNVRSLGSGSTSDFWLVRPIWEFADADGLLQSNIAGALAEQLDQLAESLEISLQLGDEEPETLTTLSTPNEMRIIQGHFVMNALLFVSPITENLVNGWYDRRRRKFVSFELSSGRRLASQELARLMGLGKIFCPGFHAVIPECPRVPYIRANPNNSEADNLLDQFRLNPPDEPVGNFKCFGV